MGERRILKYKLKIWDECPIFAKDENNIYKNGEEDKTENPRESLVDFFV